MADQYQRGDLLPVRWTLMSGSPPTPQGSPVTLDITGYDFDDMVLSLNVTSTRHQGRPARIGGQGDSKGNITAYFDLDNAPYQTPPNIRPGVLAKIEPFVTTDLSKQFSIGILVTKVHWSSKLTEALAWNFDWEESVLASPFQYPAGATGSSGPGPGGNPQGNP